MSFFTLYLSVNHPGLYYTFTNDSLRLSYVERGGKEGL